MSSAEPATARRAALAMKLGLLDRPIVPQVLDPLLDAWRTLVERTGALTVVVMGVLHRVSGRSKRGRRHYRLAGLGRLAPPETLYHPPMTAPRSAATPLDPREAKRSLRERVVQARDALPMATRVRYADTIIARVRAREDFQSARTVLLSLAFRSEWETRPLFNAALELGKTLVVPRVNLAARMLDLYAIERNVGRTR